MKEEMQGKNLKGEWEDRRERGSKTGREQRKGMERERIWRGTRKCYQGHISSPLGQY